MQRTIISLFDRSGTWSAPYRDAGYRVLMFDVQTGGDVMKLTAEGLRPLAPHGMLIAMPCTHFAASGARWWAAKDADGRTADMLALLDHTLTLVRELRPAWWALENPVGRIHKLRPELGRPLLTFDPCDYGDPYTKRTCLWGDFNPELHRNRVEPELYTSANGKRGSWYWAKYGGSSLRTKNARSVTPSGFARAFFDANR